MADSKRQKIVSAAVTRMQTILTAGGFETNLGQKVYDWVTDYQQSELPALSVCDLPAERAPSQGSDPKYTIWLMPIQFRVYAEKDATPANIRKMLKDVQKAIKGTAEQDDRFPVTGVPLVMQTQPVREGPLLSEDTFEIIGGVVEVEVVFKTEKFNAE